MWTPYELLYELLRMTLVFSLNLLLEIRISVPASES